MRGGSSSMGFALKPDSLGSLELELVAAGLRFSPALNLYSKYYNFAQKSSSNPGKVGKNENKIRI